MRPLAPALILVCLSTTGLWIWSSEYELARLLVDRGLFADTIAGYQNARGLLFLLQGLAFGGLAAVLFLKGAPLWLKLAAALAAAIWGLYSLAFFTFGGAGILF